MLHYGLRNPYRYSFDRLTGDLYIGDVGQDAHEGVDFAGRDARGLHFGWTAFEGTHAGASDCEGSALRTEGGALRAGATHTPPIFEADRRMGQTGHSRTGYPRLVGMSIEAAPSPRCKASICSVTTWAIEWARWCAAGRDVAVTPIFERRDPNLPNVAAIARVDGAQELRSSLRSWKTDTGSCTSQELGSVEATEAVATGLNKPAAENARLAGLRLAADQSRFGRPTLSAACSSHARSSAASRIVWHFVRRECVCGETCRCGLEDEPARRHPV